MKNQRIPLSLLMVMIFLIAFVLGGAVYMNYIRKDNAIKKEYLEQLDKKNDSLLIEQKINVVDAELKKR